MDSLLDIGNDIAAIWGAICYDYTIDEENKEVVFECNERGEEFVTSYSFEDLKENYDFDMNEYRNNMEKE